MNRYKIQRLYLNIEVKKCFWNYFRNVPLLVFLTEAEPQSKSGGRKWGRLWMIIPSICNTIQLCYSTAHRLTSWSSRDPFRSLRKAQSQRKRSLFSLFDRKWYDLILLPHKLACASVYCKSLGRDLLSYVKSWWSYSTASTQSFKASNSSI